VLCNEARCSLESAIGPCHEPDGPRSTVFSVAWKNPEALCTFRSMLFFCGEGWLAPQSKDRIFLLIQIQ
jgi:hypothetical protein